MTNIHHHIPETVLDDYRAGIIPHAFSVVVASHLSLCHECRARYEAADVLGGALLNLEDHAEVTPGLRARVLGELDSQPAYKPALGCGTFPAPVMAELDGEPPRWRMLGGGIRQQILSADQTGTLRLLYIPPGKAVPEHGHRGLELTLVLQGSFADSEGCFGRGDVEVAHDDINHQPLANAGLPCICLAATDAPLRFHALLPRLLQPLFRI